MYIMYVCMRHTSCTKPKNENPITKTKNNYNQNKREKPPLEKILKVIKYSVIIYRYIFQLAFTIDIFVFCFVIV